MESRDRIGEASGAREAKSEKVIGGRSEIQEELQAESEANEGQAVIADPMEMLRSYQATQLAATARS